MSNEMQIDRSSVTLTDLRENFAAGGDNLKAKQTKDGGIVMYKGRKGLATRLGFKQPSAAKRKNAKVVLRDAITNEYGKAFADRMFRRYDIDNKGTAVSQRMLDGIARQARSTAHLYFKQKGDLAQAAGPAQPRSNLLQPAGPSQAGNTDDENPLIQVLTGTHPDISEPKLAEDFLDFAKKEYSDENVDFLREVRDFEKLPQDDSTRRARFERIVAEHVTSGAAREVNLRGTNSKPLAELADGDQPIPKDVFAKSKEEIRSLLDDTRVRYEKRQEKVLQDNREMVDRLTAPVLDGLKKTGYL
jgi:hypothetical protein